MSEAYICSPLRSPVGGFGGRFVGLAAHELGASVVAALVERTGVDPNSIDDVILGQCYPTMEAPALGRVVALDAGLPTTVPGRQVDRRCGSGLQATLDAVMMVRSGAAGVVVAGGAESMSNASFFSERIRWGAKAGGVEFKDSLERGRLTAGGANFPVPGGMIETAENLRRDYSISREEQDEFAARSQARAAAAQENGTFDAEIVPIEVPRRRGEPETVRTDEHIRPGTTVEKLAGLRPIMGRTDAEATVTAGNASGQNDGASACLVASAEQVEAQGLTPMLRIVSWAVAGVAPDRMGIGPVPATALALERAGLSLADIDLIELNEAFASQVLACTREWRFGESDFDRLNVHGSGISLGHPVGATGGRILATLAHEMHRRGARYGLETMCIGGGQGLAAIVERVDSL